MILLVISWIWLLAGLAGMVLTSPNLVAAIANVKFWEAGHGNKAAWVSAWGRLRLQAFMFVKCLIYFCLGLIGVTQPGPQPWVMTVSLAGLTVIPLLLIILAIQIAHDDRRIIAAKAPRDS